MKITIIHSNRKTLALHVKRGEVYVRAPYGTPNQTIENFVRSKQSWIVKHQSRYEAPSIHRGQESVRLFGKQYQVSHHHSLRLSIRFENDILVLAYPMHWTDAKLSQMFDAYFKKELEKILQKDVAFYAQQLNIAIPPFIIRKYKTLHGRCSRKGELAFNTYLYHESTEFIAYVVLHECAHILEFNHSQRFYALIEDHMPHYKEIISQQKNRYADKA